ncbi:MAG TPA: hypothetical protein VMM93_09140, partial [Vicinamibacterales bacterium]|nr:hypothetical protein [Vicinamibacterales bacterium]
LAMAAAVANLTLLATAAATAPAPESGLAAVALLGAVTALLAGLVFARSPVLAPTLALGPAADAAGWFGAATLLPAFTRSTSRQPPGSRPDF